MARNWANAAPATCFATLAPRRCLKAARISALSSNSLAELSTTQIYTFVSIQQLKQVHSATHPARLEPKAPQAARPRVRARALLL